MESAHIRPKERTPSVVFPMHMMARTYTSHLCNITFNIQIDPQIVYLLHQAVGPLAAAVRLYVSTCPPFSMPS